MDNSRGATADEMPPPAAPSQLMPPPPVPVGGIKLKVKRAPSTDQAIAALLPDAAPAPRGPPAAPSRMSPPRPARASERSEPVQSKPSPGPPPVSGTPTKKRKKESSKPAREKDVLDDLLGEEIDAIERAHAPSIEDELLGGPQPKKIKLHKPVEKEKRPKEKGSILPFPAPSPVTVTPSNNGEPVRIKLNKKPPSRVESQPTLPPAPVTVAAPLPERAQRPSDLPATTTNTMPFNVKRAKALISSLSRNPNAIIVSPTRLEEQLN